MRSALPATRQAAGVPSAWSQPFPISHARPRRWCDAGSLGRQSVTAAQKAGDEGRVRDSVRNQGQGQRQVSATAAGISDSQQRSATDAPSWTRCSWSPPGRSGRACSRWDLRGQGVKCIARGGRPLDPGDPIDWGRRMNDPEVTMNNALPKNNLIATEKAIEAAAAAISLVKRVPAPLKSIADQVVRSASSVPANLVRRPRTIRQRSYPPLAHRVRISERSRHPPSPPSCRRRHQPVRRQVLTQPLRRSPSHHLAVAQPKMLIPRPDACP